MNISVIFEFLRPLQWTRSELASAGKQWRCVSLIRSRATSAYAALVRECSSTFCAGWTSRGGAGWRSCPTRSRSSSRTTSFSSPASTSEAARTAAPCAGDCALSAARQRRLRLVGREASMNVAPTVARPMNYRMTSCTKFTSSFTAARTPYEYK